MIASIALRHSLTRTSSARLAVAMAAILAIGAALAPGMARQVLLNTTPSEPIGLYARTDLAPQPGRLVAFLAPAAAFPYANRRLGYLRRVPILKMIVAGPGDHICAVAGQVVINAIWRAPIVARDGQGRALPHWRGCRRLADGELFALSDRVPNSFDSRYFGPVSARSVIGVFRPLVLAKGVP